MDNSIVLRIADDVLVRELGEESVLLNLSSGVYFSLDSVGTRMWQLISEGGSLESVIAALQAEYDVDEGQLCRDIDDLTNQLIEKGLVTID